jgi:hypothetical protein
LKSIFEKIFKEGTVPKCFKSGIITPVYKKQDKPINNPNSYRRITVSSVIGKLFEKVILHKISPLLKESQNPLQNIFSKIDFNKYTRDDPPNLKCSADNNCSSWDLPFFISHTNLSNNSRLTNSVSD